MFFVTRQWPFAVTAGGVAGAVGRATAFRGQQFTFRIGQSHDEHAVVQEWQHHGDYPVGDEIHRSRYAGDLYDRSSDGGAGLRAR